MNQIDITCPVCQTKNTRRLSLIYSEGLSTGVTSINTRSTFSGAGGSATTSGTTSQVHQTEASKLAAPPQRRVFKTEGEARSQRIWGFLALTFALGLVFMLMFTKLSFLTFGVLFIASPFVANMCVIPIYKGATKSESEQMEIMKREDDESIKLWNMTYHCDSCGNRFLPKSV